MLGGASRAPLESRSSDQSQEERIQPQLETRVQQPANQTVWPPRVHRRETPSSHLAMIVWLSVVPHILRHQVHADTHTVVRYGIHASSTYQPGRVSPYGSWGTTGGGPECGNSPALCSGWDDSRLPRTFAPAAPPPGTPYLGGQPSGSQPWVTFCRIASTYT